MCNAGLITYIIGRQPQCAPCSHESDNGDGDLYRQCLEREAQYVNELVTANDQIKDLKRELDYCRKNSTNLASDLSECKSLVNLLTNQLQQTKKRWLVASRGDKDCSDSYKTCLNEFHSCQQKNLELELSNQKLDDKLSGCNNELSECKSDLENKSSSSELSLTTVGLGLLLFLIHY